MAKRAPAWKVVKGPGPNCMCERGRRVTVSYNYGQEGKHLTTIYLSAKQRCCIRGS